MVKSPNIPQPATATSPSSSTKRKKVEEEDPSRLVAKKQRTRVSFSCGECHRRKQKCNREIPCSHCLARKVPELCKAYTPGKTEQDFNARISRLERIVESALPAYCSPGTPDEAMALGDLHCSTSACADDDDLSQTQDQDPAEGTFESGKWYGNSVSGSVAPGSVLAQLENLVTSSSSSERQLHKISQVRSGKSMKVETFPNIALSGGAIDASSIMESVQQDTEPSAADNLNSLVLECGLPPHKISELFQELPPKRFSDVLVGFYFNTINWTRYPVSESDFRSAYSSICANGIGTNPNHVRFLPLLFVVLATAVRLAPENIAGDARTRRITSLRYYWSSRRSLLIAAAVQPDSLDVVLTRLLSARFLTFDRRITECWSQLGAAVRTAQALGLHRDGSTMGMDPSRTEYRRRIWSYLYHADRSYALVLGRPNAIQDDYTSTQPPLNIDDESSAIQIQTPRPLSSPTSMSFVILRHALAAIIGRMVHHYQQVRTARHYAEVLALDDELMSFVNNLPSYFALSPDTSFDKSASYIPVHRFLLITEIWFVRISLHRPYFLRRLGSDRYRRSRRACFESAMKDFEIREAFRATMPREARDSLSNAYREFQTAMISGIYLVLTPRGKDAAAMHAILDGFIKDHENIRDIDDTTKKELKIIAFLKAKASRMEGERRDRKVARDSELVPSKDASQPPEAQLLLDLQQSSRLTFSSPSSKPSTTSGSTPSLLSSASYSADHTSITQFSPLQLSQHQGRGDYALSPTASGSPGADDESAAQSLLDHLCNTVSHGSNLDSFFGTPGLSWGGPGAVDFPAWVSTTPTIPGCDPRLLVSPDGSDWSYWEALVSHIQKTP